MVHVMLVRIYKYSHFEVAKRIIVKLHPKTVFSFFRLYRAIMRRSFWWSDQHFCFGLCGYFVIHYQHQGQLRRLRGTSTKTLISHSVLINARSEMLCWIFDACNKQVQKRQNNLLFYCHLHTYFAQTTATLHVFYNEPFDVKRREKNFQPERITNIKIMV